jgi:hypothetical protein
MSKVVINPITSGYRSAEALNANFQQIEAEFENTLSLDGSSPNAMQSDLDMNSHKIANLGAPTTDTDVVRYIDMENYVAGHGGGGGGGSGVVDAIVNGVTDVAPSQNAVFDALALKANASDLAGKSNVGHTHPNQTSRIWCLIWRARRMQPTHMPNPTSLVWCLTLPPRRGSPCRMCPTPTSWQRPVRRG